MNGRRFALPLSVAVHLLAAAMVIVVPGLPPQALPEPMAPFKTLPLWPHVPRTASLRVPTRVGPSRHTGGLAAEPTRAEPPPSPSENAALPSEDILADEGDGPPPIVGRCPPGCSPGGGPEPGAGDRGGGDEPPSPRRLTSDLRPPTKLKHVDPVYPELARRAGVEGTVVIECVIGPQGRVVDARAVEGHLLLKPAALQAVQQWIYTPTLLNGQALSVILSVTVQFRLRR